MALDPDILKLLNVWAEQSPDNRQDPSAAIPSVDRNQGWSSSYSGPGGFTPERKTFNQLLYEENKAAKEFLIEGVLPWSSAVDFPASTGITKRGSGLWRALVATGPATNNATDPLTVGQTVWERFSVHGQVPQQLLAADILVTPGNAQLDVKWLSPANGVNKTTLYTLQWKSGSQEYNDSNRQITTPYTVQLLTQLVNNTLYTMRIRGTNADGAGLWSEEVTGTPAAQVPDRILNLTVVGGAAQVHASWSEPEDNGAAITAHTIQWKSGNQDYDASRQAVVGAVTEHTIGSLVNGTEYTFRMKATNGAGDSPWSNEAKATPQLAYLEYTVPGTYTVEWPYAQASASLEILGGKGGDGGAGGAGGAGAPAAEGDDGEGGDGGGPNGGDGGTASSRDGGDGTGRSGGGGAAGDSLTSTIRSGGQGGGNTTPVRTNDGISAGGPGGNGGGPNGGVGGQGGTGGVDDGGGGGGGQQGADGQDSSVTANNTTHTAAGTVGASAGAGGGGGEDTDGGDGGDGGTGNGTVGPAGAVRSGYGNGGNGGNGEAAQTPTLVVQAVGGLAKGQTITVVVGAGGVGGKGGKGGKGAGNSNDGSDGLDGADGENGRVRLTPQ